METTRNQLADLPINDILDGGFLSDAMSTRQWIDEDGIQILGTHLGSSQFIGSCPFGKEIKHRMLLTFIHEVAKAGFPRETVAVLTGAADPRLTHLLKSVERNSSTEGWMKEMDSAHVSTWLHCPLPHRIWIKLWDRKSIISRRIG